MAKIAFDFVQKLLQRWYERMQQALVTAINPNPYQLAKAISGTNLLNRSQDKEPKGHWHPRLKRILSSIPNKQNTPSQNARWTIKIVDGYQFRSKPQRFFTTAYGTAMIVKAFPNVPTIIIHIPQIAV